MVSSWSDKLLPSTDGVDAEGFHCSVGVSLDKSTLETSGECRWRQLLCICLEVHLHEDRNSQNANNPPSAMHSDSIDRVVDPESKGHTKTTTSVTISANHYTTTSVTASHLRATISPDTRR